MFNMRLVNIAPCCLQQEWVTVCGHNIFSDIHNIIIIISATLSNISIQFQFLISVKIWRDCQNQKNCSFLKFRVRGGMRRVHFDISNNIVSNLCICSATIKDILNIRIRRRCLSSEQLKCKPHEKEHYIKTTHKISKTAGG